MQNKTQNKEYLKYDNIRINSTYGEKYIDKNREKIFNILIKKHKFPEDQATRIEEEIHTHTVSEMAHLYTVVQNAYVDELIGKTFLINKGPDWISIMMSVPLYQSLGDTIGYYNGNWEFNYNEINRGPEYVNTLIYEFIAFGGINDLSIVNWRASDDTILYKATLKVLYGKIKNVDDFGKKLREAYLAELPNLTNRHPGETTLRSLEIQKNIEWDKMHYDSREKGAGAAMRSGCIGLIYPGKHNRKRLIALAVETSRITHNSTVSILGSIVTALFTAYAIEKVPVHHWPHKLLRLLQSSRIDDYMKTSRPNEFSLYSRDKGLFVSQWENYVTLRFSGLSLTPKPELKFMKNPVLRFKYLSENFSKANKDFPGSCADDAGIFAYDALLESGDVVEKLIVYSILHPGDSDTVGSIAMSWFGAFYTKERNWILLEDKFADLEFINELTKLPLNNWKRVLKVYYRDIYLHIAKKRVKRYISSK